MIRRVTIANLAPTGEGVARTPEGVGFVAGALPAEEVDAEVLEVRKKFWKGRAVAILQRSPLRREGRHAEWCAGCDWAHFDLDAALAAKRQLFLETMERIGELSPGLFGDLPITGSPLAYRVRVRFHVSGRGEEARIGYFAPRTHRVEPAGDCEALSAPLRSLLPGLREAIAASTTAVTEVSIVEDLEAGSRLARATLEAGSDRAGASALLAHAAPLFDGLSVASSEGPILARGGERRLWVTVAGRDFPLTPGTFFQANRHLAGALSDAVRRQAAAHPTGSALDLFGGVGLFAGALLDAGHSVVSVEANHSAVEQARAAKNRWRTDAWRIEHSESHSFLERSRQAFDVVVADPPRAGLGLPLSRKLARSRPRLLLYVSCETATLGRDLAELLDAGLSISGASLYDLFPLTHRVEAVIALSATGGV